MIAHCRSPLAIHPSRFTLAGPGTPACDLKSPSVLLSKTQSMWIRSAGLRCLQPSCQAQPPAPLKSGRCHCRSVPVDSVATRQFLERLPHGFRRSGIWNNMKRISEQKPATAPSRPNAQMTGATPRKSRPVRSNQSSGFPRSPAKNAQNTERNYQRYLVLARAEALAGDRIAAENYFQHAEHFLRSMAPDAN